jgi:hypothetical protein
VRRALGKKVGFVYVKEVHEEKNFFAQAGLQQAPDLMIIPHHHVLKAARQPQGLEELWYVRGTNGTIAILPGNLSHSGYTRMEPGVKESPYAVAWRVEPRKNRGVGCGGIGAGADAIGKAQAFFRYGVQGGGVKIFQNIILLKLSLIWLIAHTVVTQVVDGNQDYFIDYRQF